MLMILVLACLAASQAAPAVKINPIGPEPALVEGEYGDYVEGDMVITKDKRNGRHSRRWPNNVVYYAMDSTVDAAAQKNIQTAISRMQSRTCVRWVKRTNQKNYVNFHRPAEGCNSPVGMTGTKQTINLGRGCTGVGTIIHEMLHAMGFHHEHNREDRDQYVTIMWQNVVEKYRSAYKIARGTTTYGQPYDFKSIMHYNAKGFSTNGQPTIVPKDGNTSKIGQRQTMSEIDVKKVAAMYGCSQTASKTTKAPVVTSGCADDARYASTCRTYKQRNLCGDSRYLSNALRFCKKSCNLCGQNSCQDHNTNCEGWAKRGECTKNPNYMTPYCRKSCNKC